jgi:sirohydrochlorin cobaltochelatase
MKAILIAAHGTADIKNFSNVLEPMVQEVQQIFKEAYVSVVFTSEIIIDKLFKNSGITVPNVKDEIEKLIKSGYKEVYILSLYIIPGREYYNLRNDVEEYRKNFTSIKITTPLLTEPDDYKSLVHTINISPNVACVFMAHGTNHQGNDSYIKLQREFISLGYDNVFVGTIEGKPSLEDIVLDVKKKGIKELTLSPLLLAKGRHGTMDLNNWEKTLMHNGLYVYKVDIALGEMQKVRNLYINKLKLAQSS